MIYRKGMKPQGEGFTMSNDTNVAILLVNTGSPSTPTPEAVRIYLKRFLSDPRIAPKIPIWPLILNCFILPKRSKASAEKYQSVWLAEGSPLTVYQNSLAQKLQNRFTEQGVDVVVRNAYSYSSPDILEACRELKNAGVTHLVVLPIFPQTAYSQASGTVVDGLDFAIKELNWNIAPDTILGYSDNARYIEALADNILAAGFNPHSSDRLFLSYHSIPLCDVEAGDTYPQEVATTNTLLVEKLGLSDHQWRCGFQSRFDKERSWLSPFTVDVMEEFATQGDGILYFICPNFAIDCLETLYDIPAELQPAWQAVSEAPFVYVPCLNDSDAHVEVLYNVIQERLSAPRS